METKRCCATCKWHFFDREINDWLCVNNNAEDYNIFTYYEHCCEEWEELVCFPFIY